jgi:sensor histidine kinase YesM/streptogramin lyase
MRHRRYILLCFLTYFIIRGAEGQQQLNYSFRHIDQRDGLLHNEVLSIAQDAKGFIWVAGANGLQRYDGSHFIYYPDMLSNPAEGLTPGADMSADKAENVLWISNGTDMERFALSNNKSTVYTALELMKDSSFTRYHDENNKPWLLGPHSICYFDSSADKTTVSYLSVLPPNAHQSSWIVSDSSGVYTWLVAGFNIFLFDKSTKRVYSNVFNPSNHPLLQLSDKNKTKHLRFLMMDSRQNIWITTWTDLLYKFDPATKKISSYSLGSIKEKQGGHETAAPPLINCLLEDDNHVIWVGTENAGLLRYNPVTDNFDYCVAEEKNSKGIRYNYKIFSLFQDREQNIWIGTDRGISIFNPYRQYFESIRHDEMNASVGKSEIISAIQSSGGDIYIGTWGGGIAVYDRQLNYRKSIFFPGPADKNKVWSFQEMDDGNLWIGCQHGYLLTYNTTSGVTKTEQPPEMEISTIRCMAKDNKGNILFGLHSGKIVQWNKQQQKFLPFRGSTPVVGTVTNIFIDKAQHCWVSTTTGFKEFDADKMQYTNTWLPDSTNPHSISGRTCQGIEEYNDSTLLIGTTFGSLNFFNKRTKLFTHLAITDGLPNTVYAIKKDETGYIWFTTDYGICKFDPHNNKIISYRIDPGHINASLHANNIYPLQSGQWLVYSTTEAITFSPQKIALLDEDRPTVEITGFRLFDKPLFIDTLLSEKKAVSLSYKDNFFTVEFAALNFSDIRETNYYYRLDGIDKDWVNGGTNHFAHYTDLPPGEYSFNVKAGSGNTSGEITSFRIIIVPPFWKTPWFIALMALCVLAAIFILVRWRGKNIKTIAAEKLKVQQLRAEDYKNKLELEQIINYFSSSLSNKIKTDEVLWDTAKNLIGRLGFVDCMIYLWNDDKTRMIQKAGFGPKGSIEEIAKQHFDVLPGQGVVGYVIETREPVLIPDTSKDKRYRTDDMIRLSEITVPVIYNDELIGVIDCEHPEAGFFTQQHLQILNTIATLIANKIKSIEAEQSLRQTQREISTINEQLSSAKLEALRSQMNPHFIFNCINSIDALIQSNDKYHATIYLNKFARLLRSILSSSRQNTVTLSTDLETLRLYIELEQLRNENKFTAEINADEVLLQDDYKVPPLIIQPFVENAILHGIRYRQDSNGKLIVSVQQQGEFLRYVVEDNGVGRNAFNQTIQKEKKSYGIDMSNDRVRLFNNETIPSVQITDLFEGDNPAGTKVVVLLKIR